MGPYVPAVKIPSADRGLARSADIGDGCGLDSMQGGRLLPGGARPHRAIAAVHAPAPILALALRQIPSRTTTGQEIIMRLPSRLLATFGLFGCAAIIGASAVGLGACAGGACQVDVGTAIVKCDGDCPSASRPNCYVRFRKENSQDEWTETDDSTFDRTPGMEWSCYCDR